MQLTGLLAALRESEAYRRLLSELQEQQHAPHTFNIIHAARPFMIAALAQDWDGPILYLTSQIRRAYNVAEQLPVWLEDDTRIYRFAEPGAAFYERVPWDREVIHSRIRALAALTATDDASPIVITSVRALLQRTLPPNRFHRASLLLRIGERHNIEKLVAHWVAVGYDAVSMVTEPGTFSRRGGIIDVYPITADYPVRIEFFDDEVDSLRLFDPSTQRSIQSVEQIYIPPAREALPENGTTLAKHLASWFEALPQEDDTLSSGFSDYVALESGMAFPNIEHYLPYFYPQPASLFDYAPLNTLIVIEDPGDFDEISRQMVGDAESARALKQQNGQLPPDFPPPYVPLDMLTVALEDHTRLQLDNYSEETTTRLFSPGGRYGGQLRPLLADVRKQARKGDSSVIITQQPQRLAKLWSEETGDFLPLAQQVDTLPPSGTTLLLEGAMQAGWTLNAGSGRLHLMTDAEIYGWSRPEPRRRRAERKGRAPESGYADWQVGDYVVHVDYGIGRFAGMARRTIDGNEREYLLVEYAGTDRLFVPIHQADRLTRYVGNDEKAPQLHTLGKQIDWVRTKSKARKAVEEEARELLALYAARAQAQGFAFSPDGHWQHELEASFPYVETLDQLRALREVKADMEQPHPMDRLICGDVGYGKTEVALRAAFKAVMDGKQVAVLVPTTVLAQQHYMTFSNRMSQFPVKIEMLSRFRTKEQQSRILTQLASGEIDIMIGTHRILSNDVTFKDLGLVIIDEEQRFGVKHKEHFKKLRTQIDVLTMTATPIPRTLYMSLTGARDISMIQTPPEERLPVMTHVGRFDDALIRQAVLRELDRGGQIFFVHNRIRTIDVMRERLEHIVPEARIVIAHGQMSPRQLEAVMTAFARDEYDILLSTAIIENGIDMPNVNTLIVDRADGFGISQLYQLRGRVGRGAQQAYAYFFHHGVAQLTAEARERLDALAEYTDLGAGFQIAMRDLELRGAGDILSTRQSGHVAAIGLHLYTQLLTQAIRELKGEDTAPPPAAATERIIIDLPVPAYLPTDWLPEMALRLQVYRRIAALGDVEDVELMRDELRDRFGQLPDAVEGLLYQMQVKLLAQAAGATAIIKPQDVIQIKLPYLPNIDREALAAQLGADIRVTRTAVELPVDAENVWQLRLLDILSQLAEGFREALELSQ